MAGVTFDAVTKRFDDVTAVDSFSLDVADREFLVLLGPSGCGKTTVLRMLAGLDDPTSGSIRIGGEPVVDVDPKDRDVAMVFQSYALYPHMTVARNIEFPLASRGTPRDRRAAMVADTARLLGLEALLGRKPAQLSGGQRQRVALARAIVRQPQVFLMDEPLSNLDAKLRIQTRADIVELQHRLQTTTLYVTHDQVEAMTMADRIAVMNEGRLQQLGPPQEIYERPANVFVARFIGSPPMNTVDGVVAGGAGGGATVRLAGAEVALPAAAAAAAGGAGPVVVGLRPEDLALRPDGQLAATVAIVELLGHDVHVICRLEDGTMLVVRQGVTDARPRQGDAVRVAVGADRLALFGADGGRLTP